MKKLMLAPAYTGNSYRWTMKTEAGEDSLLSTEKNFVFLAEKEGTYNITFSLDDGGRGYKFSFPIIVVHEEVEYSPYTASVYEYKPAPGQFINTMPQYEDGDTEEDMRKKAEESLLNNELISLGAYGGYVTFAFDHTVVNVPGEKDFFITGNSFYSDIPDYKEQKAGSCEPGIVMVAFDKNMNGIPDDDEWYELAGSEYTKSTTIKNYSITYRRPSSDHKAVPDRTGNLTDTEYIAWTDNQNGTGYVAKNRYHSQDYFPKWSNADEWTFTGTLLPQNAVDMSGGRGTYFVLFSYPWGYADNHPNDEQDLCSFDIGWAVDRNGNKVSLPGVDFVRVYTGVNQYCGWIGETSTEIARAQDLHIEIKSTIPDDPLGIPLKTDRKTKTIY